MRHAILAIEQILEKNKNDLEALFLRGVCNRIRGKYSDALDDLYLVFGANPSFKTYVYSDVVSELAIILTKQGQFDERRSLFEKAYSTSVDAWSKIQLGISYGQLGDAEKMTLMFFDGLDSLSNGDRLEQLFSDCYLIATAVEKEAWLQLKRPEEKKKFLKRFWKKRDPNPFDEVNESLAQYFDRLSYARATYSASNEKDLDDRGKIYIRFGKPDVIFYGSGDTNIRENESWVYNNIEGGIHFDFVLIANTYELRPLSDAVFTSHLIGEKRLSHLFQERSHIHPYYAELAFRFERKHDTGISYRMRQDYEKMEVLATKHFFAFHDPNDPIFMVMS